MNYWGGGGWSIGKDSYLKRAGGRGIAENEKRHFYTFSNHTDRLTCNYLKKKKMEQRKICSSNPPTGDHVNRLISLYNTNQSFVSSVDELEEANILLKKKNLWEVESLHWMITQTKINLYGDYLRFFSAVHSKNHKVMPEEPNLQTRHQCYQSRKKILISVLYMGTQCHLATR